MIRSHTHVVAEGLLRYVTRFPRPVDLTSLKIVICDRDDLRLRSSELKTEAQYREVVHRYIVPRLGRKPLATMNPTDVSRMLRDMATPTATRPTGYSPTAQRLARSVLRAALAHAESEGHITRNDGHRGPCQRL